MVDVRFSSLLGGGVAASLLYVWVLVGGRGAVL